MFGGHPKGLPVLFFTELWERFSYYGMRALLVLFLTDQARGGFGLDEGTASAIYGLYTGSVYLAALPGGWIADRLIGASRAVFIGGCLIAAGHFSMAVPSKVTFYLGLVLIVIGTGLLKPNVSALIGDLYPEGGARRDAGFSIFYMGINLGAFIGPLVCGWLGQRVDWHLGFAMAGIGMVAGLIHYKLGQKHLIVNPGPVAGRSIKACQSELKRLFTFAFCFALLIAFCLGWYFVVRPVSLVKVAERLGLLMLIAVVLYFAKVLPSRRWTYVEKMRMLVIFFLFIGSAAFWAGFEQAGSSLNLFADRLTRCVVLGLEFPSSWFQSVNPLLIIVLAPAFAKLWTSLGSRQPSIPVKFGLGLLLLATGFFVLAWGAKYATPVHRVSPAWLFCAYTLHTVGELCLSPVGLSSVTKLAPRQLVGQMMGVWFMGGAVGNLTAGRVGGLFDTLPLPGLFSVVGLFALAVGLLFLVLSPHIRRFMHGVE